MNEINLFQRKKEISYYSHPSSEESIKTIYDYIFKQDSTIKSLEKEIENLKIECSHIKSQHSQMQLQLESKPSKNDLTFLMHSASPRQSSEDLKGSIMSILCSTDYHSHSFLQLKNEFIEHKKAYDSSIALISQRLSLIEGAKDQKTLGKDAKKSDPNLVDVIIRNNKAFDNTIKAIREDYSTQFNRINKRFAEFDNDFDRLIASLKQQFQTVNETLSEMKDTSQEMTKTNEAMVKSSISLANSEVIKDIYATLNKLKADAQRNEVKLASIAKGKAPEQTKEGIKSEMLLLRKEINEDFDLINHKILDQLQNQGNEIKELYNLIESYQQKSDDPPQLNNDSGEVLTTLEQEIDKKANIEQLNYAMEAQAKINEALCSVNRTARWSWSNGKLDQKGMILWGVQNINTSLDIFAWNSESSMIIITLKGIYHLTTGIITSNNSGIVVFINGVPVNERNSAHRHSQYSDDEDNLLSLSEYYALSEGSKIQIGLIMDEGDAGENGSECFLEINKII